MKKRILPFVFASLLCAGFISCDEESDEEIEQTESAENKFIGTVTVGEGAGAFSVDSIECDYVKTDGKLDLTIYGVKFAESMPVSLNVTIPGISFEEQGNNMSLSAESVIPTVGGKGFPQYTVSGLTGTISESAIDLSLNFGEFPTKYNGTK